MEALNGLLAVVETWGPVRAMRASTWVYPLVSWVHLLGIGLLFGTIAVVDLQLAGRLRALAQTPLRDTLVPLAMVGFALALTTGLLLFAAAAREYLSNPWFAVKLALIAAAGINAAVLHLACRRPQYTGSDRLAGLLSLTLWAAAMLAGRMLAFG